MWWLFPLVSTASNWPHFSTIRDRNSVRCGSNAGSNLIGIRSDVGGAIKWVCGTGKLIPSWKHSSMGMSYQRKISSGFK